MVVVDCYRFVYFCNLNSRADSFAVFATELNPAQSLVQPHSTFLRSYDSTLITHAMCAAAWKTPSHGQTFTFSTIVPTYFFF